MATGVQYRFNGIKGIAFKGKSESLFINIEQIAEALRLTNEKIDAIDKAENDLFSILGMRNLSAFVGGVFAKSLASVSNKKLIKNPHQDGYPDLLAMTKEGSAAWTALKDNLQDKRPFSPFLTGGFEVKATCGSVPTPAALSKKALKKPEIGDSRIGVVVGYDWKAHHRLTNNLIGLVWDFIDKKPTIVAVFYSSDLLEGDWGEIVQPKKEGGRTTSASIMTRQGILKMYKGWAAVIDKQKYVDFFNKFNKSNAIDLKQLGNDVPLKFVEDE